MYQVFLLTMILISGITHSNIIEFAEKGDLSSVQECVTNGAYINSSDKYGTTALKCTAWEGHLDVVQYFG